MLTLAFPDFTSRAKVTTERSQPAQRNSVIHGIRKFEIMQSELSEARLTYNQTFHKAIASNFPVGWIGILNEKFHYTFAEGKGLEQAGLTPEELIGRKFTDTVIAELAESRFREVLAEDYNVTFEAICNDRTFEVNAGPFHNGQKRIMVVLHDITTLKNTQQKLVKALAKEKELGELKSRFVTLASHEFRTPLTTILTSSFLLESYTGEKFEETKATHIGRIKRSVKVLTEMLNDFLSLGKLEEGQVKPSNERIQMSEFVKELEFELEPLKREKQMLRITYTGQPVLTTDRKLIRSILYNLASNAFKYTHNDDQVYIDLEATNDWLTMQITDHGMGIPVEEQNYIFKRFYRAHNASNIQGTGLGLNIVKKYVNLLNGTINFVSNENKGTVFIVTVPAEPIPSALNR